MLFFGMEMRVPCHERATGASFTIIGSTYCNIGFSGNLTVLIQANYKKNHFSFAIRRCTNESTKKGQNTTSRSGKV